MPQELDLPIPGGVVFNNIIQYYTANYPFLWVLLGEQGLLALGAYDMPHTRVIEPTTLESYPST